MNFVKEEYKEFVLSADVGPPEKLLEIHWNINIKL